MELVTLEGTPLEDVLEAFNASFAGYYVPFVLDEAKLERMLCRRGFDAALSVGAVENGRLAGFSLTGFGAWNGETAGYGSGTGVLPPFRSRGLAGRMIEHAAVLSRERGAPRYVLEVLVQNEPARRAYERSGFRAVRELSCWAVDEITPKSAVPAFTVHDGFVPPPAAPETSWHPSWQNSSESLARAIEPLLTIEAAGGAARAVVAPESGDLAQFFVAPGARRRGLGRALLAKARSLSAVPLRILNVDASDAGTDAFLRSIGAREIARQVEMVRSSDV